MDGRPDDEHLFLVDHAIHPGQNLLNHTVSSTSYRSKAKSTAAAFAVMPPCYKSQVSSLLRTIFGPALTNPPETGPVCTRRR